MRERKSEETIVARDESFEAQNDLRERGENQQREQNRKTEWREPIQRAAFVRFAHELARILCTNGNARQVFADEFAPPPRAGCAASGEICELIFVKFGANETRRMLGKRIFFQQRQNVRRTLQQPFAKFLEPRILLIISERREPHL